jgi:hypothetical protein
MTFEPRALLVIVPPNFMRIGTMSKIDVLERLAKDKILLW